MTTLLIIFMTLVGGVAGYFFGSQALKHVYTALGRPYFHTTISHGKERGSVTVDAQFNNIFIYEMERTYRLKGEDKILNSLAEDNEKVAVYLYDVIANIAENYLPSEHAPMEDIGADVPAMGFRGGEEVRQVVDLGKPSDGSNVDFVG